MTLTFAEGHGRCKIYMTLASTVCAGTFGHLLPVLRLLRLLRIVAMMMPTAVLVSIKLMARKPYELRGICSSCAGSCTCTAQELQHQLHTRLSCAHAAAIARTVCKSVPLQQACALVTLVTMTVMPATVLDL
jgi:hypothetical protein